MKELKRLGITHILNCAAPCRGEEEEDASQPGPPDVMSNFYGVNTGVTFYKPLGFHHSQYFEIAADDDPEFDLSQYFKQTTRFIETALDPSVANNSGGFLKPSFLLADEPLLASSSSTSLGPQQPASLSASVNLSDSRGSSTLDLSPVRRQASFDPNNLSRRPSAHDPPANHRHSTTRPPATGKVLVHCREGYSRSPTITIAYLLLREREPLPSLEEALRLVREHRNVCPNIGFLGQLVRLDRHLRIEDANRLEMKQVEQCERELQENA